MILSLRTLVCVLHFSSQLEASVQALSTVFLLIDKDCRTPACEGIDGKSSMACAELFAYEGGDTGVCHATYSRSLKSEVEAVHLYRSKYTVVFYCLLP